MLAAREAHGISERRACAILGTDRTSVRTGIAAVMTRRCGLGCVHWRVSAGGSAIGGLACF